MSIAIDKPVEALGEDEARWEHYVLTGEAVPHERVRGWLQALAEGRDEAWPR